MVDTLVVPRRYKRRPPPRDLWADLGPGDPGYRLRPGRTGFDPFEQQQEMGRLHGMGFKYVFWGRYSRYATLFGFVALMTVLVLEGELRAIAVIGAVALGIGLLWRISHEHLMELRKKRGRPDMPFKTYDGEM